MNVRAATAADLPAVRAIYNHSVLTSTCTFQTEPTSEEEHARWFAERGPAHPVLVAEDGEVVGWAALSPWKPRGAYARTVEASVYVRHDRQRRGVGRALLQELIERARSAGHHVILGGTCTEQPASVALQEGVGFVRVGLLREVGFKFGRWLDLATMQLMLAE